MTILYARIVSAHNENNRYFRTEHFAGADSIDTDLPTEFEAHIFNTPLRKLLWLFIQPAAQFFRPLIIYPKAATDIELLNLLVQIAYNALIVYFGSIKVHY